MPRRMELEMLDGNRQDPGRVFGLWMVQEQYVWDRSGFTLHSIKFPLVEDKNSNISKMYWLEKQGAGRAFRAYFISDQIRLVSGPGDGCMGWLGM